MVRNAFEVPRLPADLLHVGRLGQVYFEASHNLWIVVQRARNVSRRCWWNDMLARLPSEGDLVLAQAARSIDPTPYIDLTGWDIFRVQFVSVESARFFATPCRDEPSVGRQFLFNVEQIHTAWRHATILDRLACDV